MRERVVAQPGCDVGDQRQAEDVDPRRTRRDRLVDGRHPYEVRADRTQHPNFGRCLVLGAAHRRVDALFQRGVDCARDPAEANRVCVRHVDELRSDQG